MRSNLSATRSVLCLLFCLLILLSGSTLLGQDKEEVEGNQPYPEKRKSEETWEAVLSFPGKVIFFPLKLLFGGIGTAAAAIDEGNVVQKIVDFFTSDDGRRNIHPVYSARTGGGPKFYQEDFLFPGSRLKLQATLGPRFRQKYKAVLQDIRLGPSLSLDFQSFFLVYPDEKFFGLGNTSDIQNVSNYAYQSAVIDFNLRWRIDERTSLETMAGYEYNRITAGRDKHLPSTTDLLSTGEDLLPGLRNSLDFGRMSLAFFHDGKNHPGRPTSGSEIALQSSFHQGLSDSRYAFWKLSFDATHYIHLFYGRTLVVRLAGQNVDSIRDKAVPFYHLSEIGRTGTVRGYDRGRFLGEDLILGSLEYRYPVWTFLDALVFVDAGKVSDNLFGDLSFRNLHYGYGGGLRFWGKKGPVAKFEIAWSEDGHRLYFEIYTAF